MTNPVLDRMTCAHCVHSQRRVCGDHYCWLRERVVADYAGCCLKAVRVQDVLMVAEADCAED